MSAAAKGYSGKNDFIVVASESEELPDLPENFEIHRFDSTSFFRLNKIFLDEILEVFIISDDYDHTVETYRVLRTIDKEVGINILDTFELEFESEDKNLSLVPSNKIIANRLIDKLPNVPVLAQNVGLGIGEVMEVAVPFGSSFVYRSISTIYQKNWKIVGIYRDNKLKIAMPEDVIQPNDNLLIIGDPVVLKNVFQAIKREMGQFPAPFGNNIYLYIDMKIDDANSIFHMVDESLNLNKKLKNKRLIIRIVNPTNIEIVDHLKKLDGKKVALDIEYDDTTFSKMIKADMKRYSIGMVMVSKKMFSDLGRRNELYKLSIPILKFGKKSIEELKESIVIMSDYMELQEISPVVFDFSSQIGADISMYEYQIDDEHREEIIEHYGNLAKLFSKKVEFFLLESSNPIRVARQEENFIQFLPFNENVLKPKRFWFLSTNVERMYFMLDDYYQVFVPVTL